MLSPRGLLISRRHQAQIEQQTQPHRQHRQHRRQHPHKQESTPSPSTPSTQPTPLPTPLTPPTLRKDDDRRWLVSSNTPPLHSTTRITATPTNTDKEADGSLPVRPVDMATKRKQSASSSSTPNPASVPGEAITHIVRSTSTTPTIPVRIRSNRQNRYDKRICDGDGSGARGRGGADGVGSETKCKKYNPNAISPSVAALLAITNIPRSRALRSLGSSPRVGVEMDTSTDMNSNMAMSMQAGPDMDLDMDMGLDIAMGTNVDIDTCSPALRARHSVGGERVTVSTITRRAWEADRALSRALSRHPLEVLLSAPDEGDGVGDDAHGEGDGDQGDGDGDGDTLDRLGDECDSSSDDLSCTSSALSTAILARAASVESVPSLDESSSLASGTLSPYSAKSLRTPSLRGRRSSCGPMRRQPEPVLSPPGSEASEDHPLSLLEDLDFRVFRTLPAGAAAASKAVQGMDPSQSPGLTLGYGLGLGIPLRPLKSAFKSNLTASLRALRTAARSISNLNMSSIPPEDFLTRSILAIDPRVPFTDERRPPPLDEEPSAALRRYLNPATNVPPEPRHPISGPQRAAFTASIQMQTYRVQRSRGSPSRESSAAMPHPSPHLGPQRLPHQNRTIDRTAPAQAAGVADAVDTPGTPEAASVEPRSSPAPTFSGLVAGRPREMRENSDFIRIAVMEMAMRKRGKLDDQRPGRARWALPPRRACVRPYEIGPDGVPLRWVAFSVS